MSTSQPGAPHQLAEMRRAPHGPGGDVVPDVLHDVPVTDYTIRPIREHEWRQVRDLRLTAVQDEAADLAFTETYDEEAAKPDAFWQDRATGSSSDAGDDATARQVVAVAADGSWVGTAVVLIEAAGAQDYEGRQIEQSGGHIVGVYVHPDHRGSGLLEGLFEACLGWVRERDLSRARLYVHRDNTRAQAAYHKCGFVLTGAVVDGSLGRELEMARTV